ncbi:MAG TPA: EamA family transporter [Rhodobacteraceae bacterium]|jgi:drug/metabolite transporter (DMT)-like permease|nr:EamA family transporter [Paracoccaceae bacterium]
MGLVGDGIDDGWAVFGATAGSAGMSAAQSAKERWLPLAILVALGAVWGLSLPLTKIAVSTGHAPLGLVVWELVLAIFVLQLINLVRRRPFRFRAEHLKLFIFISVFGNLIPTTMWFVTSVHLPSGILAIVLSLVPMFALPVALFLRLEHFRWLRLVGVLCGAVAIVLLIGPGTSLPDPSKIWYVLLALIGPVCYGIEGNGVAKMGLKGLDSVQVLLGASIFSLIVAVPMTLVSGQWVDIFVPWGQAEYALIVTAVMTTIAYAGYVWLVGRAGSVFAAQSSYLVTGFGVMWSILILAETYSGWVWMSLILMLAGLFLVQPRRAWPLVSTGNASDNNAD